MKLVDSRKNFKLVQDFIFFPFNILKIGKKPEQLVLGKYQIIPVGTLERFNRLFGWGERRNIYKRGALKTDKNLSTFLNLSFAEGS